LALGIGLALTATAVELISTTTGILLAGAAALAMAAVLFAGRSVSWTATAAATFATLLAGLHLLLPAYNQQFALGRELRTNAYLAPTDRLTVFCYPQRYDSVSYYLPRADVRVYTADQKQQLFRDLERGEETLLLVKSGGTLRGLLAELPPGVEFVSRGRQGAVTVGWVRMRAKPPDTAIAQRE
jgi:hypothetical protein